MVEEEMSNAPAIRGEVELGDLEKQDGGNFNRLLERATREARERVKVVVNPEEEVDFDPDGDPFQTVEMPALNPYVKNTEAPAFRSMVNITQLTRKSEDDGIS